MRDFLLRPPSLTSAPPLSARRSRPLTTWRLRQVLTALSLQAATLSLLACAARPLDTATGDGDTDGSSASTGASDPGTTGGGTSSPTTSPATTTGTDPTTTTTGATTGSTGSTGQPFIVPLDGGPPGTDCDPWAEDCPEGQKCMAVSLDGDNAWESLRCVPVVDDPDGLYEPCSVLGTGVDGLDTCDEHMMCWDWDQDTKIGHCVGMCTGSPDNPSCGDPDAFCALSGDGVLILCLPQCNPLLQDCHGDELCIPNPQNPDSFLCVIDASGREGQVFDVCEFVNVCDPGLFCVPPMFAAECDQQQAGCCLPFCDLSLPNDCPGAGQQCLPWSEDDPPEDLKNVGLCGLMQ
jgi:hypothetical protein